MKKAAVVPDQYRFMASQNATIRCVAIVFKLIQFCFFSGRTSLLLEIQIIDTAALVLINVGMTFPRRLAAAGMGMRHRSVT